MKIIPRWESVKPRTKWPLATMAVGDCAFIGDNESGYARVRSYAFNRGKALDMKFSCSKAEGGMVITRTA